MTIELTDERTPAGYTRAEGMPELYWGPVVDAPSYRIQQCWNSDHGHYLHLEVGDVFTAGEAVEMSETLATFAAVVKRLNR